MPPAQSVPDFDGAGKKPGLEIWRIENMKPEPLPKDEYGKFSTGDSYICLKTTEKKSGLEWDIFFWLGEESTRDEMGVAAYKTVELDEMLGGGPVQHREVQGHESDKFMQCFPSVEYRSGGVESGFKKVERGVYETRLLHVKGSKSVRVNQVELSHRSLNAGDVFLLDQGLTILQWNGAEANSKEKAKALEVSTAIKDDERGGKAEVVLVEQGAEPDAFWEALGGKGPVAAGADDDDDESGVGSAVKLMQLSDETGSVEVTEVGSGASLERDMLKSEDVFILDTPNEIFVWVGKGATPTERKEGMLRGVEYVQNSGRPTWTKVSKVAEGGEPVLFRQFFKTWKSTAAAAPPLDLTQLGRSSSIAKARRQSSSSELAAQMNQLAASEAAPMVDDGNGKTEIFRVENFEPMAVAEELYGQFFAGDSYLIKYTYRPMKEVAGRLREASKEEFIIYFWLGRDSTADEKGAAALIATRIDGELGGAATQVRVVMGKEPPHLVRLFKGKMVVHAGGKASGFKNQVAVDTYDDDGVSLYHVRGTDELNTRAVQVEEAAGSLNSGDCFVLLTPATMFVWRGEGANETERATAATVAATLQEQRKLELVDEGEESEAFWGFLGGKGEYTTSKDLPTDDRVPRLFQCSNKVGSFEVEEIVDFAQGDLEDDDCFLLDAYTAIYVWVGGEANETEQAMVVETAAAYVAGQGYPADTPVVTVHAGSEPRSFSAHFLGWSASAKKEYIDPYLVKLEEMRLSQQAQSEDLEASPTNAKALAMRRSLRKTDSSVGSPRGIKQLPPKAEEAAPPEWILSRDRLRKTESQLLEEEVGDEAGANLDDGVAAGAGAEAGAADAEKAGAGAEAVQASSARRRKKGSKQTGGGADSTAAAEGGPAAVTNGAEADADVGPKPVAEANVQVEVQGSPRRRRTKPTAAPQETTGGGAKEPTSPAFDLVSFAKDSERNSAAAKTGAEVEAKPSIEVDVHGSGKHRRRKGDEQERGGGLGGHARPKSEIEKHAARSKPRMCGPMACLAPRRKKP